MRFDSDNKAEEEGDEVPLFISVKLRTFTLMSN